MSNVKLKRNSAELNLSKALWHKGYRYRLNMKGLPGSPDIAITKYHLAIFVDGEFWHGKDFEIKKNRIQNNKSYWIEKINENIQRDLQVDKELSQRGWIPIHFWSKEVINHVEECVKVIEDFIYYQMDIED